MVATGLRAGTGSGVQAGSSTSQTRVASVARRNCFPAWHPAQNVVDADLGTIHDALLTQTAG